MVKKIGKTSIVLISSVLIFQLMGCGTILYPERKGQRGGRIDVGVALLDGVGLLLFVIPGVIAYAVDFNNGTIYLPGGSLSSLEIKNLQQVKFDPKHASLSDIERMITEQAGITVKFDQLNMRIDKLKSTSDMMEQFAKVLPNMNNNRIAWIH